MADIWVDVENGAGAKQGGGPLRDVIRFACTRRLDRAGEWSLEMPALDARSATLLTPKAYVRAFTVIDGAVVEVGGGQVEEASVRLRSSGPPVLQVRGADMLRELTRPTVGESEYASTNQAPADLLVDHTGTVISAWTLAAGGKATTDTDVSVMYAYENVLAALVTVAERTGEHFRWESGRKLFWIGTQADFAASGLLATANADPIQAAGNTALCFITEIEEREDAWELCNQAYLFGAGDGQARLTTAAHGTSLPAGWTIETDGSITHDDSVTAYGIYQAALSFKDLGPIENTDQALEDAANDLVHAGYNWLRTRSAPQSFYSLSVTGAHQLIYPGTTIEVEAREWVGSERPINISATLNVLEVDWQIDARGVQTTRLTVGTVDRYSASDAGALAEVATETRQVEAHPQMALSVDTTTYREPITDAEYAQLVFWLAEETTLVYGVKLRYKVAPFNSMLGYWSGGAAGTAYTNVGTTGVTVNNGTTGVTVNSNTTGVTTNDATALVDNSETTASGVIETINEDTGSSSPTDPHDHDMDHGHSFTGVAHDHAITQSGHSHGVTDTGHGHGVTDSGHGHGVTDAGHRHTLPWGYIAEDSADTYNGGNLEFSCNGGSYASGALIGGGAHGWYEVDVTANCRDATTKRPTATDGHNYITARVKAASMAGKTVQLVAQVQARYVTQSLEDFG